MFTTSFLTAVLERACKSFAYSLSALLLADGTDLLNTAWGDRLSVAGMATLISVLGSFASGTVGSTGPSLANEVISPPAVDPADDHGQTDVVSVLVVVVLVIVWIVAALF